MAEEVYHSNDSSRSAKEKGALSAAGGAGLIRHSYTRGMLNGRKTLYHGTHPENVKSIMKEGIIPSKKKNMIDVVQKAGLHLNSKGLSFMSSNRIDAHTYANQSKALKDLGEEKYREKYFGFMSEGARQEIALKSLGDYVKGKVTGPNKEGVIQGRVPTWRLNEVENPEYQIQKKQPSNASLFKQWELKHSLKDSVFTNKGTIPNKYLKGSPAFERASVKEVGGFIKRHPLRFSKGLAVAGSGAALVAYGARKFLRGSNDK